MGTVERLARQVQALSNGELAEFRTWFLELDWAEWDRQIERDARFGRLDAPGERALQDHTARKSMAIMIVHYVRDAP